MVNEASFSKSNCSKMENFVRYISNTPIIVMLNGQQIMFLI